MRRGVSDPLENYLIAGDFITFDRMGKPIIVGLLDEFIIPEDGAHVLLSLLASSHIDLGSEGKWHIEHPDLEEPIRLNVKRPALAPGRRGTFYYVMGIGLMLQHEGILTASLSGPDFELVKQVPIIFKKDKGIHNND